MATYAIGDIQGCYYSFQKLLAHLDFNVDRDKLWLVGDIVNRGSGSLEVLRWCHAHQESIQVVLGNHDLHTIVVAHGIRSAHRRDTIQPILDAPDAELLLTWLRHQPLMVANDQYVMVHAGLYPQWHVKEAMGYAREVEAALQSDCYIDFLNNMYGNKPKSWDDNLSGYDRLRFITNAMTRMRVCHHDGALDFDFKGPLTDLPKKLTPWFDLPGRQSTGQSVIFGHWSALGLYCKDQVYGLDTGCLWGGQLTALCLETKALVQVNVDARDQPLKV